jgi:hypothetical protein
MNSKKHTRTATAIIIFGISALCAVTPRLTATQESDIVLQEIERELEKIAPQESNVTRFLKVKERLIEAEKNVLGTLDIQSRKSLTPKLSPRAFQKFVSLSNQWHDLHKKFYQYTWDGYDFPTLRILNKAHKTVETFGAAPAYRALVSALNRNIPPKKLLEIISVMKEMKIGLRDSEQLHEAIENYSKLRQESGARVVQDLRNALNDKKTRFVVVWEEDDDEEQEDAPVARKTPQEIELQLKQIRATLETLTPQKSTYEPFCSLKEQLKELGESIMQSMNHSVKKGAKESAQKTLALLKKEQLALLPLWDRLHMKFYHYVWESLDFQTLRALNEKFNSVKKFGAEPAYLGLISALRQGIPAKKVLELLKVMTEVGIVLSIQEELLDLLRKALTYTVTRVDERTPVLKAILENFFDAKPEIVQAISEMFSSEDREKDVRLAKLFDILTAHVKSHEKPQSKIGSALKTLCPNCLIPNP